MAYDWWDNKIAGRRKAVRTQKAYRPELELHLLPFFGGMAVKDISRRDVDAFVQQQIKKGLAPSYINSHLQRLGQILDLAMDWYQTPPVLLENPAKGKARRVENPNTPDADRWLEPDQVELLLHAARKLDEGAPQTRVSRAGKTYTLRPRADYLRLGRESIVAGLCFSGLRNTELCDLTWARIDFARRLIRPGGTKTRAAGRDVNITDGLLPYLIAHRNQAPFSGQGDPVWPTATGRARNKDNLNRRILQPVVEKARELIAADAEHSLRTGEPRRLDVVLPDSITAHTFRRTFCGFTTEVERDPAYAQAQLGHADPKFTSASTTASRAGAANPMLGLSRGCSAPRAKLRRRAFASPSKTRSSAWSGRPCSPRPLAPGTWWARFAPARVCAPVNTMLRPEHAGCSPPPAGQRVPRRHQGPVHASGKPSAGEVSGSFVLPSTERRRPRPGRFAGPLLGWGLQVRV
jgi:integrase